MTDERAPADTHSDATGEVVTARVTVGRWWFTAVLSAVAGVWLTCALIGVPHVLFEDPSPMMVWLRMVAIVGVPLAVFSTGFYLNGALRPQHLRIDAEGISTPDWAVGWMEIREAGVFPDPSARPHKQQLTLVVTDEAFVRLREANRWHSGRPFHMGGLPATVPIVRTQGGTRPSPAELLPQVQARLQAAHEGTRPPRRPS